MKEIEFLRSKKLTPTEINTAINMFNGKRINEIAKDTGKTNKSILTYLSRARIKTGSIDNNSLFVKIRRAQND